MPQVILPRVTLPLHPLDLLISLELVRALRYIRAGLGDGLLSKKAVIHRSTVREVEGGELACALDFVQGSVGLALHGFDLLLAVKNRHSLLTQPSGPTSLR